MRAGVASIVLVFMGASVGSASTRQFGTQEVGQLTDKGKVISSDQYINPIGDRLVINNGKIMASSVSPDGTHLAALVADGGVAMTIVDLKSWQVQQVIGNSTSADLKIRATTLARRVRRTPPTARRSGWPRPTATASSR